MPRPLRLVWLDDESPLRRLDSEFAMLDTELDFECVDHVGVEGGVTCRASLLVVSIMCVFALSRVLVGESGGDALVWDSMRENWETDGTVSP